MAEGLAGNAKVQRNCRVVFDAYEEQVKTIFCIYQSFKDLSGLPPQCDDPDFLGFNLRHIDSMFHQLGVWFEVAIRYIGDGILIGLDETIWLIDRPVSKPIQGLPNRERKFPVHQHYRIAFRDGTLLEMKLGPFEQIRS